MNSVSEAVGDLLEHEGLSKTTDELAIALVGLFMVVKEPGFVDLFIKYIYCALKLSAPELAEAMEKFDYKAAMQDE